jgi:hypothetical protein
VKDELDGTQFHALLPPSLESAFTTADMPPRLTTDGTPAEIRRQAATSFGQDQKTYAELLGLDDDLLKQYGIKPGRDDGPFEAMWDAGYRAGHGPLIRAALARAMNVSNTKSGKLRGASFWREVAHALDGGDGSSLKPAPPLPAANQTEKTVRDVGRRLTSVRQRSTDPEGNHTFSHDIDSPNGLRAVGFTAAWADVGEACADFLIHIFDLRKVSLPYVTGDVIAKISDILSAVDDLFESAIRVRQDSDEPSTDSLIAIDAIRRSARAGGTLVLAPQLLAVANRPMSIEDRDVVEVVDLYGRRVSSLLDHAIGAWDTYMAAATGSSEPPVRRDAGAILDDARQRTSRELVAVGAGSPTDSSERRSTREGGTGGSKVLRATPQQADDEWVPEAARTRPKGFRPQDPDAYDNTIGEESQDPEDRGPRQRKRNRRGFHDA